MAEFNEIDFMCIVEYWNGDQDIGITLPSATVFTKSGQVFPMGNLKLSDLGYKIRDRTVTNTKTQLNGKELLITAIIYYRGVDDITDSALFDWYIWNNFGLKQKAMQVFN